MAKQLNLLAKGQVVPTALHTEMQQSYLEYAMSVIVGRALPDVRDGLKPVHRRIVYAMHELGLTPDRPYRKCARVVGDVLGKYHPHGDQSVYDALVRLVQDFSSRYPLLGGHGNFGSVDDDPPAAMRYTETRLSAIGNEVLLNEIGEATVDFVGNFDNSQQEPTVLPAQLPILLLNGSSGIAVGMATNIPPHNLGEIVDGLVALIDRPTMTDEQLFELIPGPDFPTGGEIMEQSGIHEAYRTGRGSIVVRGISQLEDVPIGRGKHRRTAIIVTELPFQVNKAAWIEKIAELVNQGRLDGIADIRDESDRDGMRVVIEIKREANPQAVLNYLYKQTALQSTFGAILLALVDGQPRQLTLRQLLEQFLQFREETLTRRYNHQLSQAENRIHLLEGLLTALTNLDAVIDILRNAPDGTTAKVTLQERFQLSDRQSDAVLSMPLRRLTGLERQNLQTEFEELRTQVQELRRLLGDRHELLKALKKDLRSLKRKYSDPRRTRIANPATNPRSGPRSGDSTGGTIADEPGTQSASLQELEFTLPVEEVVLEFTQRGYVRRLTPKAFQRQRPKETTAATATVTLAAADDLVTHTQTATTAQDLIVLTREGKAYTVKVKDIPPSTGRATKGTPLFSLLPIAAQSNPQAIITQFLLINSDAASSLLLVSRQGKIKRIALTELSGITGRGLVIMKFKDDDELQYGSVIQDRDVLCLATSGGRLLKSEINEAQLPLATRTTQGIQALRLRKQEQLVGYGIGIANEAIVFISEQGYAKRVLLNAVKSATLGGIGVQTFQFVSKTDALAGMVVSAAEMLLLTSTNRSTRLPIDISIPSKDRLLPLEPQEKVTLVSAIVPPSDSMS